MTPLSAPSCAALKSQVSAAREHSARRVPFRPSPQLTMMAAASSSRWWGSRRSGGCASGTALGVAVGSARGAARLRLGKGIKVRGLRKINGEWQGRGALRAEWRG